MPEVHIYFFTEQCSTNAYLNLYLREGHAPAKSDKRNYQRIIISTHLCTHSRNNQGICKQFEARFFFYPIRVNKNSVEMNIYILQVQTMIFTEKIVEIPYGNIKRKHAIHLPKL